MKYTTDEYENTELDEKADDIQWNNSDSSVLTAYLKEISKYPVLSRIFLLLFRVQQHFCW